jgi:hypothetical protein
MRGQPREEIVENDRSHKTDHLKPAIQRALFASNTRTHAAAHFTWSGTQAHNRSGYDDSRNFRHL